ncbi:hypothetical protein D9758_016087 [Tetrapyrgos nigripes]|uniref:Myb/SANT-like domain-containing protein n=1 Tax=Tetrapyrgos nigripes TaxID=182062 RepID=A0A8H5CK99_9AGAR|nr:hypothetical protein D9758_016087 [Tetrapyrgos nigripes]
MEVSAATADASNEVVTSESVKRRPGRPKGSKNKPKDNVTTTPKPKKTKTPTKTSTPRPRANYSADDDKVLMAIFLDQKGEGNQMDNGGWKSKAINAAVKALEGSEKKSGGAPKSPSSIHDHYDFLKNEFKNFNSLAEKSGWGWDEENQRVEASDEQWETLIESQPHLASYRDKTFHIYAEMKELLQGALATGNEAFHAGAAQDSDSDISSESGNEADVSFEDIAAATKGTKCKSSALDGLKSKKHSHLDHGGKPSTAESISGMTHAIDNVAIAIAASESEADKKAKKDAIRLVQGMDGLSKPEIAKILVLISKDVSFVELLLEIDNEETRMEVLRIPARFRFSSPRPLEMSAPGKPKDRLAAKYFIQRQKVGNKSGWYLHECSFCHTELEHCDNKLLKHLSSPEKCPGVPSDVRKEANRALMAKTGVTADALNNLGLPKPKEDPAATSEEIGISIEGEGTGEGRAVVKKRKGPKGTMLDSYVDYGMSKEAIRDAHVKLFSYLLISPQIYCPWENLLRISRESFLPGLLQFNPAFVYTSNVLCLEEHLTSPVVLCLEDMTADRASADRHVQSIKVGIEKMELDVKTIIAVMTDNPTVMQAARRKMEEEYYWILTFPCFLHGLNTIIGKIVSYEPFKRILTGTARFVSYFNGSHFWGGQLEFAAKALGINHGLETKTDTHWYSLSKQGLSVEEHKRPSRHVCIREDATKKTNGYSPVAADIVHLVLHDNTFWDWLNQLLRVIKPLVDAIGNLEAQDTNLADCMLELIRCAHHMNKLVFEPDDNYGFFLHVKAVFNREFITVNTDKHSLALFLHPMCRKLAVHATVKGCTLLDLKQTALAIAHKWRWDGVRARKLADDMEHYFHCRAPFTGHAKDGLSWWENLAIDANDHPIKTLAITLFEVVPHAADVERLFSDLGAIQGDLQTRLSVEHSEELGMMRSHYNATLVDQGLRRRYRHGHTHTKNYLETNFLYGSQTLPIEVPDGEDSRADLVADPVSSITSSDVDQAFARLAEEAKEAQELPLEPEIEGQTITVAEQFDEKELEQINKGLGPESFQDNVSIHVGDAGGSSEWSIDSILSAN